MPLRPDQPQPVLALPDGIGAGTTIAPPPAAQAPAEAALPPPNAPLPYLLTVHDALEDGVIDRLQRICELLRTHTGHDFAGYKHNTLLRRIERRMHRHQLPTLDAYVHYLSGHPAELSALFRELLIGVTRFFRDAEAFTVLKQHLSPLVLAKPARGEVRVWAAGCSTGEEAYSLAIVLLECLDAVPTDHHLRVQLFASDLSPEALAVARAGCYPATIAPDVGAARLARFFQTTPDGGYQIRQQVRDLVVFAHHDLNKDAPFIRLDLLCCRNLLIYFSADLQRALIPVFHYALQPDGLLLLGPSESLTGFPELFTLLNGKWKLARRLSGLLLPIRLTGFPFRATAPTFSALPPLLPMLLPDALPLASRPDGGPLAALVQRTLLHTYTPAAVAVTPSGEVLYVHGRTGRYLEPAPGPGALNVFEMAREALRYVLREAVLRAVQLQEDVVVARARVKTDAGYELLRLNVRHLTPPHTATPLLLIAFEALPTPRRVRAGHLESEDAATTPPADLTRDALLMALDQELQATRHRLQNNGEEMEITVEELKSTNEELKSTNEELQSANEELQSTNEEAMTNKEELQTLNEELMKLNLQHLTKTEELLQGANDMKNLLDATELAIIFLDNNFIIKRFTPAATQIIPLLSTDVGRPLTDFATHLRYDHLMRDIGQVLHRLTPLDLTLQALTGEWYALRVLPYRTLDNYISGAVLTFTDITTIKRLEADTQRALAFSESMQEVVREPVVVVEGADQQIFFASASFAALLHTTPGALRGRSLAELGTGWDQPALREPLARLLDPAQPAADAFDGLTLARPLTLPGIGAQNLTLYGRRLAPADESTGRALIGIDIQPAAEAAT